MDNNLDLIKDYLARHVDNQPVNLTLESKLNEIGIDSMALLELMFEFEDKYDFSLPGNVQMPETVDQLLKLIEKYKPSTINE